MSSPVIEPLVLGLGGNVGGELAITGRFQRARDALAELGELSSAALYRTAPIGPAQPPYLNTAIRLRVPDLQPAELIAIVRELEGLLGRERSTEVRWGPRTFDLDVLVWGARVLATPDLDVPHPRLHERRFALAPLVELLGEAFEIPRVGPAGAALARTRYQALE
ncbi:MAG: 2-amino-4-hydroxy-6-hydroxymethyldihydropteridine diphosphokinase, partial [Deltaproteobacteria bacterium]|nr:2-amino-4-hydroxy-6-hydroxymethyldihydropteridine diphosphokinase [Deltaproteobacteria bacterium]